MGIELSPRINNHGFRKKRESSCLAFLDVWILFGCILLSVPPLYLPINQPIAYYANRPRAIFHGQSFPASAKRNTTRVRKRPMCCVLVCCCCCCCCCSCTRGFVVWLLIVWMCKVWFSPSSGSESLPLRLQQSEFRGGQSPHHLSPIFHRHPRHLGGVFPAPGWSNRLDW